MNTSDQSGSYTRIDPDSARSGGLRPSTPPAPCAPGLVVTVGECAPVESVLAKCLPDLAKIRPDVVLLHTYPDDKGDPGTVATVRRTLPGVRVWMQSPANILAGLSDAKAVEAAARSRGLARGLI